MAAASLMCSDVGSTIRGPCRAARVRNPEIERPGFEGPRSCSLGAVKFQAVPTRMASTMRSFPTFRSASEGAIARHLERPFAPAGQAILTRLVCIAHFQPKKASHFAAVLADHDALLGGTSMRKEGKALPRPSLDELHLPRNWSRRIGPIFPRSTLAERRHTREAYIPIRRLLPTLCPLEREYGPAVSLGNFAAYRCKVAASGEGLSCRFWLGRCIIGDKRTKRKRPLAMAAKRPQRSIRRQGDRGAHSARLQLLART